MKKILLNTKTYIGPLNRGNIDFYSIYKNQLYVISEDKFKYILNYLKIQFPDKSKIGFDISTWLYKKKLLNENFLSEISSKILNVPKDFSESDVYYYLSNKNERRDILFLFEESLKNAYLYGILKNDKEKLLSLFVKFLNNSEQNLSIADFLENFCLYFLSDKNHCFFQAIEKFKLPSITLKDKFFFERVGKFLNIISCDGIYKQYFFPKRYNLEFLLENSSELEPEILLENMLEIKDIKLRFEQKIFKKIFSLDTDIIFKSCENTNFCFINFDTMIFLVLFADKNFDIKVDNRFYNFFNKNELLNYFTKTKMAYISSYKRTLEPYNYAKVKFISF